MRPDPPVQLRQYLAVPKRQGVAFDRAWAFAWQRVKWPHDTGDRRWWKALLDEQRPIWERAYGGEDVPGGKALELLAEKLHDDVAEPGTPTPARLPPPPRARRQKEAA